MLNQKNQTLNKATLRTCPPPLRFPASPRATLLSLCDHGLCGCQFVCLLVCFDSPFFFSSSFYGSDSLILHCWHDGGAAGSLHSNLPLFVITCPWDTHAPTHTHTHAETGDLVTAILAIPKLPIAIYFYVWLVELKTFLVSLPLQLLLFKKLQTVQLFLRCYIVHRY